MSWSVQAIGKSPAVAKAIELQFANGSPCNGPEEIVRQAARSVIAAALAGSTYPELIVKVEASGSQGEKYDYATAKGLGVFSNNLVIQVTPIYGFVE